MRSEEMIDLFVEHIKQKGEQSRSTHNKPEPSEWIQVTTCYIEKHRTAVRIPAVRGVEETHSGVVIYVQTEGGSISTVNPVESYDEIMSQLGVKPIERKEVKQ